MSDLALEPSAPAAGRDRSLTSRFYFAAWRWHFYAGLFVAPFLVMLALTGLVMLYTSVFFGRDGEKIAVVPGVEQVSVAAQEQAVAAAFPNGQIIEWIGAAAPDRVAMFRVKDGDAHIMVAVDPWTGVIVDQWPRQAGIYDLASDIHGTLLLGDLGDRLIEIAAGFGIVLIVTGLYLGWPRAGKVASRVAASARSKLKTVHLTVGLCASVLILLFLVSGHSWTGIWGEKFVQAWSTFPAEKWDNVPLSDETHAAMNHGSGKHVPWALEQTPMPASGSDSGITGLAEGVPAELSSLVALGRDLGFSERFHVNYPSSPTGVWTLSQDSMSNDTPDPTSDRTVHVDRHTGRILADVTYADYSIPGKAMAVGIALHEGDMGVANIIVNTLTCLSVIFLAVSGAVMWWMRRPSGARRLVAPPMPAEMPLWRGATAVMLVVSMLFPLVGLTLIGLLLLDLLVIDRLPPLRRAVS